MLLKELFLLLIYYYLLLGNLVKGVFGNRTLTEIHASLNNADKLRTLIHRIQKDLHPYGQDIQGVIHSFQQNENGIRDYLQRICMYAIVSLIFK
jgi:hypothetical protein